MIAKISGRTIQGGRMDRYEQDNQPNYSRYHESDSYERPRMRTDGSFTHSNFQFKGQERFHPREEKLGRLGGRNRFGEERVHHDSYQDDQYHDDYDPTYEDEYGMRHPYEHGGEENRWSDDLRSEASRESYRGRGPKGYKRSDERILEEACEILTRNRELDASNIEVSVTDQCIYLKGEVGTRKDKRLAEDLVDSIPGVEDVWNQIKVNKVFDEWLQEPGKKAEGPVKGLT